MEKKDKKSGRNGRGLDTIGKRILVLTIAILMTFQFCTPTLTGVSFAEEITDATEEELNAVPEETSEAPETVQEEAQPQEEAAETVPEQSETAEPVDEEPAVSDVEEQGEPAETGQPSKAPAVNAAKAPTNDAKGDGDGEGTRATDTTWTVTFYDRDAKVYQTVEVTKGEKIGEQLPATIAREDYTAYWSLGELVQGGQGMEIHVTEPRTHIDADWAPTDDTIIVPDYDQINYTVTFCDEDGTPLSGEQYTKTVNSNTSYCLNDIPAVPAHQGYVGNWAYQDGDTLKPFNNSVTITANMSVKAVYDKNVFTVEFKLGEDEEAITHQTDQYFSGDKLTLPTDPVVEGKQFDGWYIGETEYVGGETVNSDLTLIAHFIDDYYVNFIIEKEDGTEERLSQYYRSTGEAIGTLPQEPFVAGKVFEKWVNQDTGEEVTAATVVNGNITAVAQFREVTVYNITAEYYYVGRNGEVVFNTDYLQAEEHELPYTITAPSSVTTEDQHVTGHPTYYPETPTVEIKESDFDAEKKCTVRIKYVPYTAIYDFVYMVKDLEGDGYTEIDRTEDVQGVINSYVTPTVKNYEHYNLELAQGATITTSGLNGQPKQELVVKYTRKNYQLVYETNGGSFVGGVTVPYGTNQAVTDTVPTREGYTFDGWYTDEALTTPAGNTVTVNGNTTLYAKWKGKEVKYTIVYMFEKYNDAGTEASFVYDNSEEATAEVGTTVHATDDGIPDKSKKGWELDDEKNANSSVEIAADGSSVLKVYYKLIEYTFYFQPNNIGGYNVTATLNGDTKTGNNNFSYTMKVKLGQDISSTWPTSLSNAYFNYYGTTYRPNFYGWLPSGTQTVYVTKRLTVAEDMLPDSGTTLTYLAQWLLESTEYAVNNWFENATDDE